MTEGSNFQPARPRGGPAAKLPDGVLPAAPPGVKREPKAVLPDTVVTARGPDGGVAVAMGFLVGTGVTTLATRPRLGAVVLGLALITVGCVGGWAWVRTWRAYRRAWAFEKREPFVTRARAEMSKSWIRWRRQRERARAKSRAKSRRPGRKPRPR